MKTKSKLQKRSQGVELSRSEDLTVRSFALRIDTLDVKNRSIEATIATENPVLVMDMQRWQPVEEVLLMSGCVLPRSGQVVLNDSHDQSSVRSILGSTRDLRIEGDKLVGRNVFSRKDDAEDAFRDVQDGHLTDYSIGYRVTHYKMIEAGESMIIQGRTFTASKQRARRISTRWEVKHNAICGSGADPKAKNRNKNLEFQMSAPSKAGTYKLDNPTWIKPNQQSRTKPRT